FAGGLVSGLFGIGFTPLFDFIWGCCGVRYLPVLGGGKRCDVACGVVCMMWLCLLCQRLHMYILHLDVPWFLDGAGVIDCGVVGYVRYGVMRRARVLVLGVIVHSRWLEPSFSMG